MMASAMSSIAPVADADLFRLAKGLRAAIKAADAAELAADNLDGELRKRLPPEPEKPRMTSEETAAFLATTAGEMKEGKWGGPYAAYLERSRQIDEDFKAQRAQANAALSADPEMKALRIKATNAYFVRDRLGRQFFNTPAATIDGLLLKISLTSECDWHGREIGRELGKDLRALKKSGAVLARGIL